MGLFDKLKKAILGRFDHQPEDKYSGGGGGSPVPKRTTVPASGPSQQTGSETTASPGMGPMPPPMGSAPYPIPASTGSQGNPGQEPSRRKLSPDEVKSQLDELAEKNPENLEWRSSIVDLMKLVGMDSSYGERKKMAMEMGYSEEDIEGKGSAEMNIWLHKRVLAQLSEDLDGDLTT